MKFKYVLFLFLSLIFFSSCQRDVQKMIIGDWEIKQARIDNLDEYLNKLKENFQFSDADLEREKERVAALPTSFYPTGIVMEFAPDGKFYLGGIEGKWEYNPENKEIKVRLAILDTSTFIVKKISKKELVLVYPHKVSDVQLNFELLLNKVEKVQE